MSGCRYNFSLFKAYVWKDIWTKRFWKMWGIRSTLKYMVSDTINQIKEKK